MSRALVEDSAGDLVRCSSGRRPFESSCGLKILLPGLLQHHWGQEQRGWVFGGTFASAVLAALWTWGTPQSVGFLGLAFVTHIASVTDVLRQRSFPVYPANRALVLVTVSLALVLYLPAVSALAALAWPGFEPANTGIGFLVNRYAYRVKGPRQGHWVWMHSSTGGEPRAARVLAISGQEVEWTGTDWKVDGDKRSLHSPGRLTSWPQACRFKIPPNQVLVEPRDDGVSTVPIGSVVLVSPECIVGRAWAQYYPVWDRRLL
jgi:hypothetical protein